MLLRLPLGTTGLQHRNEMWHGTGIKIIVTMRWQQTTVKHGEHDLLVGGERPNSFPKSGL